MENAKIKLLDENGNYVEYKILFTFNCEELNKDYIAFVNDPEKYDENGDMLIYIAYYNPEDNEDGLLTELVPVTDEDELKMAYDVLEQIQDEL